MNQPHTMEASTLLECVTHIIQKKESGTLILSTDTHTRKFLFREGNVVAVTSTKVEELPGSFLYEKGHLPKEDLDDYLLKAMDANVRQWELALETKAVSDETLFDYKKNHATFVWEHIHHENFEKIAFEPRALPASLPTLVSTTEMVLLVSKTLQEKDIFQRYPHLKLPQTSIMLEDGFPETVDDSSLMGLRNIIATNATVQSIFDNSLLDRPQILQLLCALALLEWISIDSPVNRLTKTFVESLSEKNRQLRQDVIAQYQKLSQANIYERLHASPTEELSSIQQKYFDIKSKLSTISGASIFHKTEENMVQKTLLLIEEAYSVVSNAAKRNEYNEYLKKGCEAQFFETSQSLAHEKAFDTFYKLCVDQDVDGAAQYGYTYLTKHPDSFSFAIQYVEFILTHPFVREQKYQKFCFDLLKHHIENNEDRYESFFLLGKLCMLLGQKTNAEKSYQRALERRPDIPSLRNFVLEQNLEEAPAIVLNAIYEKLDQLNYYQLLAVDPKSGPKEVHQAYRLCCKYFHPDRFFSAAEQATKTHASVVFKAMAKAFTVLKNVKTRQDYDATIVLTSLPKPMEESLVPPTHFKAKAYYQLACDQIKEQKYEAALVNLGFALQFEPNNPTLLRQVTKVKSLKKAH